MKANTFFFCEYTEHGILFVPLKEVLTDIYDFMTQEGSEKEILVINLQNFTISGKNQTNESKHPPLQALVNLEKLFEGKYIFMQTKSDCSIEGIFLPPPIFYAKNLLLGPKDFDNFCVIYAFVFIFLKFKKSEKRF